MPAPKEVLELIAQYKDNQESYEAPHFNETQTRVQFLNPLFKALGWDVDNKAGYAEAYKDVVHEDAVKVGAATKAPDYCFRVGGARKFFLEAKKPSVNVKGDADPAYQLRRYAWSAKLPLSVLSNFGELAVYDCRARPNQHDKAAKGRIHYWTCEQIAEKWDEIAAIFSKEAVLKGSFDKFAVGSRNKRGTAEVDSEFLLEIEEWRDLLAKTIALRNSDLSQRDLNFAVQQTIDRIIFLRICEDRGIEKYGRLQALLNGEHTYARLKQLFVEADERYNSGLFHFREEKGRKQPPDELTPGLSIDDKPLKDIFKRLYYPDSPYEFSVLSADILGQVYEQFLGKVIRLTAGGHAKIEDKPEVKKAGGVYYTPTYIVDCIVGQTVGKLLEGKTPKTVKRLNVLDPACGSGSFLLGAYQYLLDWYLNQYIVEGPESYAKGKRPKLFKTEKSGWRLTTGERKRILLEHIYGVDIDTQAVEVTKLSLLLKVLEEESAENINKTWEFFHERALPDLESNIKCGNSLIGPDYFEGRFAFDDEERLHINAFDWKTEFPEIIPTGGFDAIVGNPPYVRQESLGEFKDYFSARYASYASTADLFAYFMERAIELLRSGGLFSYIVSSSFLRTAYGESLRRVLKERAAVLRIVDFGGLAVFANAKDTYVCIPLLSKGKQPPTIEVSRIPTLDIQNVSDYVQANQFPIPHQRLSAHAWALKSDEETAVFENISKDTKLLGAYVSKKMFYGIKTGFNEAFEVSAMQRAAIAKKSPRSAPLIKPFLGGQDIRRYFIEDTARYLIALPSGWTHAEIAKSGKESGRVAEREAWSWLSENHPGIATHLEPFADACIKRQDKGEFWWELRPCDYYDYFDRPKIIFPDICKAPRFHLDEAGYYLSNTAYCLGTEDRYLLGILNSRLFWFAIANISIPFGVRAGQYRYRLIYQYMEKVPIRVIGNADRAGQAIHDKIVLAVEQMMDLQRQVTTKTAPHSSTTLERQIVTTDHQIDQLVYELYNLTDKQIEIVEAGAA